MRTFATVLACLMAAAAAKAGNTLPTLPPGWGSLVLFQVDINQGGVEQPDGSVCCEPEAPECKVQTEFGGLKTYQDANNNRTAQLNPDNSGVITDFNAGKSYNVGPDRKCRNWCPSGPAAFLDFNDLCGSNCTNEGVTNYNGGKALDIHWIVQQTIIIYNITFQVSDLYTTLPSSSSQYVNPIAEIDQLTPFGENLGTQNTTYGQFQVMTFQANDPTFLVVNASSCERAKPKVCEGGGSDDGGDVNLGRRFPFVGRHWRNPIVRQAYLDYMERVSAEDFAKRSPVFAELLKAMPEGVTARDLLAQYF